MNLRVLGSVFLGHYCIGCWIFADLGVGVGVWLGPAFTKLLVGFLGLGVFSLDREDFRGKWWFRVGYCPYFENCIVDASISL
jgi:hypothetical protein